MRAASQFTGVLGGALVLAGLVFFGGATFVYLAQPEPARRMAAPVESPVAVGSDLAWPLQRLDGSTANLADFDQDVLFVNNWATWCVPCVQEMPAIERLAQRFEGRSVAFLAVSSEAADEVAAFVREQNWRLPIYLAKARPASFHTNAIPYTFILDGARRMVFSQLGVVDWDDRAVDDYLHDLLAAPRPADTVPL